MEFIIITALLVLLFFGLPLYIALFGISAVLYVTQLDFTVASTVIKFQTLQSQEFISAIPLFTFAGYLLARSKSPDRIVNLFNSLFSFIKGADAAVVIIIMALFTALTGASGVNILALGGLMYPLLIKSGNSEKFSLGLITSSGSIGLLFAPALPVIIYAIIASQTSDDINVRIDTLFQAALVPAFILVGAMIVFAVTRKKENIGTERKEFSFRLIWQRLVEARYELPLPLIVYGGIYSGIFTVMEAAVITAFYVFVIEFFLYRDLSMRRDFLPNVISSMKLAGGIFVIMACAMILTTWLVHESIPDKLFNAVSPFITNKYVFLLFVNIFLLICGCLLDIFSAILIVVPILIPIVAKYGINPYHFAIIFLVNLEIGYLTPPVGMNLFIASYRFKKPITLLYRSAVPFLLLMVVTLVLFTYVPALSTFTLGEEGKAAEMDITPPARITDLKVVSIEAESVKVSFTAVGDDGTEGPAALYKVYYNDLGEEMLTEKDLENADEMPLTNVPLAAGQTETVIVEDLFPDSEYYFVIVAFDEAGNAGDLSENLFVTTPDE